MPRLIDARQASFSALRNANLSETPSVHASSVTRPQVTIPDGDGSDVLGSIEQRAGQKDDVA